MNGEVYSNLKQNTLFIKIKNLKRKCLWKVKIFNILTAIFSFVQHMYL